MQKIIEHLRELFRRIGQWVSQVFGGRPKRPAAYKPRLQLSWVIPGKLAVGASPQPGDGDLLAKANIRVVFSLCANSEETLPEEVAENFRCLRLVLPDSRYKNEMQPSQLAAAIDIVHHSVQNELPIYVHCLAGIERSPTVCIAYLCQHHGMQLWEAVNWLKQVHPSSMPTEAQLRVIRRLLQYNQGLSQPDQGLKI